MVNCNEIKHLVLDSDFQSFKMLQKERQPENYVSPDGSTYQVHMDNSCPNIESKFGQVSTSN